VHLRDRRGRDGLVVERRKRPSVGAGRRSAERLV
jgi:hypothetical protein